MPLPVGRGWPVLAAVALAGAAVLVGTWWADGGGPAGGDRDDLAYLRAGGGDAGDAAHGG